MALTMMAGSSNNRDWPNMIIELELRARRQFFVSDCKQHGSLTLGLRPSLPEFHTNRSLRIGRSIMSMVADVKRGRGFPIK